jgi:hypothetical protein
MRTLAAAVDVLSKEIDCIWNKNFGTSSELFTDNDKFDVSYEFRWGGENSTCLNVKTIDL